MAIPENKDISPRNFQGTSYNGEFIGAMAENFGHSGYNKRSGQSGFHWGTGSALTTAAILKTKLGDIYIDSKSESATGVDGIIVHNTDWNDVITLAVERLSNIGEPIIKNDMPLPGKKVVIEFVRERTQASSN